MDTILKNKDQISIEESFDTINRIEPGMWIQFFYTDRFGLCHTQVSHIGGPNNDKVALRKDVKQGNLRIKEFHLGEDADKSKEEILQIIKDKMEASEHFEYIKEFKREVN